MDRDGSNRRQLSFGDENVAGISWSLDSRWIAYGSRPRTESADSYRTYIVEPADPGPPRYVALGYACPYVPWIDSSRIEVIWIKATYLVSLDGTPPVRLSHDFHWANPIKGGQYTIFGDFDWTEKGEVWINTGIRHPDELKKDARLIRLDPYRGVRISGDGNYLFTRRGPKDLWIMKLPDGEWDRVDATFPEGMSEYSPGWDGNELVITKVRESRKMVMIENLFN